MQRAFADKLERAMRRRAMDAAHGRLRLLEALQEQASAWEPTKVPGKEQIIDNLWNVGVEKEQQQQQRRARQRRRSGDFDSPGSPRLSREGRTNGRSSGNSSPTARGRSSSPPRSRSSREEGFADDAEHAGGAAAAGSGSPPSDSFKLRRLDERHRGGVASMTARDMVMASLLSGGDPSAAIDALDALKDGASASPAAPDESCQFCYFCARLAKPVRAPHRLVECPKRIRANEPEFTPEEIGSAVEAMRNDRREILERARGALATAPAGGSRGAFKQALLRCAGALNVLDVIRSRPLAPPPPPPPASGRRDALESSMQRREKTTYLVAKRSRRQWHARRGASTAGGRRSEPSR